MHNAQEGHSAQPGADGGGGRRGACKEPECRPKGWEEGSSPMAWSTGAIQTRRHFAIDSEEWKALIGSALPFSFLYICTFPLSRPPSFLLRLLISFLLVGYHCSELWDVCTSKPHASSVLLLGNGSAMDLNPRSSNVYSSCKVTDTIQWDNYQLNRTASPSKGKTCAFILLSTL